MVLEAQPSFMSTNASVKSGPKRRATLMDISTDTSHVFKILKKFKEKVIEPPELSFPKDLSNIPKFIKMEQAIIYKIDRDRV